MSCLVKYLPKTIHKWHDLWSNNEILHRIMVYNERYLHWTSLFQITRAELCRTQSIFWYPWLKLGWSCLFPANTKSSIIQLRCKTNQVKRYYLSGMIQKDCNTFPNIKRHPMSAYSLAVYNFRVPWQNA